MKKVWYILIVYWLSACSVTQDKTLEQALQLSGPNRSELEAVLNHYKDDSLKLQAARYLIKNMPYHYSVKEYYLSVDGRKYRPDICRFILPYRSQTEQISNLRKEILETFVPMLDSAGVTTPLEACTFLNKHLSKVIRYQETGLPFYPTIDETYRAGISRCDGICNVGVFIMRAVGIPVTLDFTTWVKMDLGHSWCAVLDNGRFYSFGPGEDQPDVHARMFSEKRHRRPAKVYRFQFDPVETSKFSQDDGYITFLKSPLLYDVTDEYLDKPTCIRLPVGGKNEILGKQSGQVYLCVYNFYKWEPIAVGTCSEDGTCGFDNVVGDNIFMVADCPDGKALRYITAPFYVNRMGEVRSFVPLMQQKQTRVLKKRRGAFSVEHTLFYWDVIKKRFIALPCKEVGDSTQTYDQIPENALLWFTIPERVVNQRVFLIENDSIKIY